MLDPITQKISALLINVWIFLSFLIFSLTHFTIPIIFDLFESNVVDSSNQTSSLTKRYDGGKKIVNTIITYLALFSLCFYPLAGFFADNKFGRYKTVVRSLALFTVILSISFLILAGLMFPFFCEEGCESSGNNTVLFNNHSLHSLYFSSIFFCWDQS